MRLYFRGPELLSLFSEIQMLLRPADQLRLAKLGLKDVVKKEIRCRSQKHDLVIGILAAD